MAEYDGSIKFSTKLDTSEFKSGIEKLSSEVSTGFGTVTKSIQNVSKTADKLSKNNSLKSFSKEFLKIGPTAAEVGKSASKSYQTMEKSVDSFNNTTAKSGAAMSDKFQTPVRSAVDASIGKINELNSKMDGSLGSAVKTAGGLFDSFSQTLIQASSTGMHPFSEAIEAIGRNFSGISGVINTCSTAIQTYQTATSLANTVSKTAEAISLLRAAGATKLQTVTALLTGTLTAESTVTAAKTVAEGAAAVGTEAHAVAQTTLNAAMRANPIGFVVAGLAALTVGIVAAKAATEKSRQEFFNMGDALDTASQKFSDAKTKADLTEDYAGKWRDLNTAINDGSLSGEALKEAEGKRKEYEQWFIENYGDYIDAEEQKNGIRQESIKKVEELSQKLSESTRIELENQALEMKRNFPELQEKVKHAKEMVEQLQNHNNELGNQNVAIQKVLIEWDKWDYSSHTQQENSEKEQALLKKLSDEYGITKDSVDELN